MPDRMLIPHPRINSKTLVCFLAIGIAAVLPASAQQGSNQSPIGNDVIQPLPNYSTKGLPNRRPATSPHPLTAPIVYTVTFKDPGAVHSAYYSKIAATIQAAGAEWGHYLIGPGNLEVEVEFIPNIATADGASVTTGFVRKEGVRDVFESGAAYELRTGTDPNGVTPDIHIRIGTAYLTSQLWFDPHPATRTDPIPANRVDAISVFTHELGHALVFNGWMNGTNGQLPPTYLSPFDVDVHFDGTNFFFEGVHAKARYGGPVPVTYANPFHLANNAPRPGQNLLGDLMNGVVYEYQTRYHITPIDLDIARDCGLVINPLKAQSLNISTRLGVRTGEDVLIGGFIVTGNTPKRFMIRGIGPSLGAFGVTGVLADPVLELHKPGGVVVTNDDWKSTQLAAIQATGIAPKSDFESAILATLAPGSYTAIVHGKNNATGVALVEGYDLDPIVDAQLANISTRGLVGIGDNAIIGGIITGPTGTANGQMLVRAIGPSLGNAGIHNPLLDPTLELHNSNGSIVASNDDWKTTQQAAIQATGIPPANDKESAILAMLAPGSYTAIVRGKSNTTGVGLVEVYGIQ